jgi:hypothetical protein
MVINDISYSEKTEHSVLMEYRKKYVGCACVKLLNSRFSPIFGPKRPCLIKRYILIRNGQGGMRNVQK